jgi:hypothetical protein
MDIPTVDGTGNAKGKNNVFRDPPAEEKVPADSRRETRRVAREWDVMMTTGTLFPDIAPRTVQGITAP